MSGDLQPPVVRDLTAEFTLRTGETIRVSLVESGLGVDGYRVKVFAERSLVLLPMGGSNTVDVTTRKALDAEEVESQRVVEERRASGKGATWR